MYTATVSFTTEAGKAICVLLEAIIAASEAAQSAESNERYRTRTNRHWTPLITICCLLFSIVKTGVDAEVRQSESELYRVKQKLIMNIDTHTYSMLI